MTCAWRSSRIRDSRAPSQVRKSAVAPVPALYHSSPPKTHVITRVPCAPPPGGRIPGALVAPFLMRASLVCDAKKGEAVLVDTSQTTQSRATAINFRPGASSKIIPSRREPLSGTGAGHAPRRQVPIRGEEIRDHLKCGMMLSGGICSDLHLRRETRHFSCWGSAFWGSATGFGRADMCRWLKRVHLDGGREDRTGQKDLGTRAGESKICPTQGPVSHGHHKLAHRLWLSRPGAAALRSQSDAATFHSRDPELMRLGASPTARHYANALPVDVPNFPVLHARNLPKGRQKRHAP